MKPLRAARDDHFNLLNSAHFCTLCSAIEQLLKHPRDTTIFAKDGKLEVNRLLLAMYSPTVQSVLTDCCSSSSISLPDFTIASVRVVLDLLTFGFTSLKSICSKDFENVLAIAKLLRIEISHKNVQVFVEDVASALESNIEDKNGDGHIIDVAEKEEGQAVDEATCKDFTGKFYHKKFRLAGSKADKVKESVPVNGESILELFDSNGERTASSPYSNLNTGEGQINAVITPEVSNWIKRVNVKGEVAKYFSPELLEKVDILYLQDNLDTVNAKEELMTDETDISKNKRKRKRNKRNCVQNKNSKKMRLEKSVVNPNSDTEIDLPGTPVFMPMPDNLSDLDDSYSEAVLIIDLKQSVDVDNITSPTVEETKTTQFNDHIELELKDSLQFETEEESVEASNRKFLGTSLEDRFEKPAVKKGYARYSEEQTYGLRKAFDENNLVSKEKAQILSKELCLTERQVKKWFQWSRAKNRVVAIKPEDKLQVKVELIDETHLEEMMDGDENLSRVEGHMNSMDSLVKCEGVQGSISMYVTPKLNQEEEFHGDEVSLLRSEVKVKYDMTGISNIVDIKRKSQTNEQNGTKNADIDDLFITSDAEIDDLLVTSDEEIDQSATPIMSLQDSTANIDESNTEHVDNYMSPIPSKTNAKQIIAKTEQQIEGLRKAFDESNFISKENAQELSKKLCLTEKQVKDWFRNQRRSRVKQNRTDDKHQDKVEPANESEQHLEGMVVDQDKSLGSARVNFEGESQVYTCELCSKSFLNKSNFNEHISSHNGASLSNNENSNDSPKVEDEALIKSNRDKDHRVKREIENLFEAYSNEKNQCKCECGTVFKNVLLLKFHKNGDCPATLTKEEDHSAFQK